MNTLRVLTILLALLVADLVIALVAGDVSPLPLGSPATLAGMAIRAASIAALALVRFWVLVPRTPDRAAWLTLSLLLLPAAVQLQIAGGRINGDGVMYYVYVRSLMKDGDLEFANEYAHYEIADRDDLSMLTDTGRRRSIFAVGPGVAWIPFFALGESVARAHAALGASVDLSGYGPHHRNAVALGSLLYGFATLALIHAFLRRHFATGVCLAASLLVWGATFLHWYMVQQPMMAHASSAAGAALVVWMWDRGRGHRTTLGFLGLGVVAGLAMCLRWQNAVLLVLPALELLEGWWKAGLPMRRAVVAGALMVAGLGIGAVPQMLAWKYIYGAYLLPHPPHGADFLRLDHPYLLQTLFSSRHGLLSWTPVFWLGFLGFLPLLRRRPALALPLLVPLTLMTYVNACSGDWWAGASFSIRRFDSQLAIFAVGFAASVEWLQATLQRRPGIVPASLAAIFILWSAGVAAQARQGALQAPQGRTFPALAGGTAELVASAVGSPPTWPASWLFTLQYRRPPGQYDRLVGRYLFYRQNNMKGRIDLGQPGDDAMLGEGWGAPETYASVWARRTDGPARLLAPLDVPEDLGVRVRASALEEGTEVHVRINGRTAGSFLAPVSWNEHEVYAPASLWKRELNEVVLDAGAPGVRIDQVNFIKEPIHE
jgi:hypothetical protein